MFLLDCKHWDINININIDYSKDKNEDINVVYIDSGVGSFFYKFGSILLESCMIIKCEFMSRYMNQILKFNPPKLIKDIMNDFMLDNKDLNESLAIHLRGGDKKFACDKAFLMKYLPYYQCYQTDKKLFLNDMIIDIEYYLTRKVLKKDHIYIMTNFIFDRKEKKILKDLIEYFDKNHNVMLKLINLKMYLSQKNINGEYEYDYQQNEIILKKWSFLFENMIAYKSYCFVGNRYSGISKNMVLRRGWDKCYGWFKKHDFVTNTVFYCVLTATTFLLIVLVLTCCTCIRFCFNLQL